MGKITQKDDPFSGSLISPICPQWYFTISADIYKPNPKPKNLFATSLTSGC